MSPRRILTFLLAALLAFSPSAAARFFSAVRTDPTGAYGTAPVASKKTRSGIKTYSTPMLGVRALCIRKIEGMPIPAPTSRVDERPLCDGLRPPDPQASSVSALLPQYLRIFLPSNPQNHRSPPAPFLA